MEGAAMDDILASARLPTGETLHIATLARKTVIDAGADHLGFEGYFLFEAEDHPGRQGITILGKAPSLDAALRLVEIVFGARGVDREHAAA